MLSSALHGTAIPQWRDRGYSALSQETVERVNAELGPSLQIFAAGEQLVFFQKGDIRYHRFAFLYPGFGQAENVDDAEMDATDFRGVIIEKSDDAVFER